MKIFEHTERDVIVSEKYTRISNGVTPEIIVQEKYTPDFRARLATQLVERWGLVAGDFKHEHDTAGRQQGRLMKPDEIVTRACDTADLLVSELHKRGWMTQLPSYSEAVSMLRETADAEA